MPNINNDFEKYYPPRKLIEQYINSHFYLNFARIESFGLTFIEALASRTPIISLGSTGINKMLKNYNIGFFLKDLNTIVMTLKKIQANPKPFYRMQKKTLLPIKQFNLDKNIKKVILLYKKIINN